MFQGIGTIKLELLKLIHYQAKSKQSPAKTTLFSKN